MMAMVSSARIGVGTQGTQYFKKRVAGAAEGGLGKVTLELGVPGLFAITWLAISILRHLWQIMRQRQEFHGVLLDCPTVCSHS